MGLNLGVSELDKVAWGLRTAAPSTSWHDHSCSLSCSGVSRWRSHAEAAWCRPIREFLGMYSRLWSLLISLWGELHKSTKWRGRGTEGIFAFLLSYQLSSIPPSHFQSLPHLVQSDFNHHFYQNTLSQCPELKRERGGLKNTEWRIRFAIAMHHSGITLEIKEGTLYFSGVVLMFAQWMTVLLHWNNQETPLSTSHISSRIPLHYIPPSLYFLRCVSIGKFLVIFSLTN